MALSDCKDLVLQLAQKVFKKGDVSDANLNAVVDRISNRSKNLEIQNPSLSKDESVEKATAQFIEEIDHVNAKRKQQANLQAIKNLENRRYVKTLQDQGLKPTEALIARLEGTEKSIKEGQNSVYNQTSSEFKRVALGRDGLLTRLKFEKLERKFADKDNSIAIAKAMNGKLSEDKDINRIAELINDNQEFRRKLINRAGGDIRTLDDRLASTRHDPLKIQRVGENALDDLRIRLKEHAKALKEGPNVKENMIKANERLSEMAKNKWTDYQYDRLDWLKTMPEIEPTIVARKKELGNIWKALSSGIHKNFEDYDTITNLNKAENNFGRGQSIAKKGTRNRILHYKSEEDWLDNQAKYGGLSLQESILRDLEADSRDLALLKTLGPDGINSFNKIVDDAAKEEQLPGTKGRLEIINSDMQVLSGVTNSAVNHRFARVMSNFRAFLSWKSLGFSLAASTTDLGNAFSTFRHNGAPIFEAYSETFKTFLNFIKTTKEKEEFADLVGVIARDRIGHINRFTVGDSHVGTVAKINSIYFKINGLKRWDSRLTGSISTWLGRRLGTRNNLKFGSLEPDLKKEMLRHGIDDKEWDVIRKTPDRLGDGRKFVHGDTIRNASDADMRNYLDNPKASPEAIQRARDDIQDKFQKYFATQELSTVPLPTLKELRRTTGGLQKGTWKGEFTRSMWLFRSFPLAFFQRILGREFYRPLEGSNAVQGIGTLIAHVIALGAMERIASSYLQGKTTPDFTKGAEIARLMSSAMGFYGDFILTPYNNYGKTIADVAFGPTGEFATQMAGLMDDVVSALNPMGGDEARRKLPERALKFAKRATPNLWATKALMDNFVFNKLIDTVDPGSTRAANRRIENETGSHNFLGELF